FGADRSGGFGTTRWLRARCHSPEETFWIHPKLQNFGVVCKMARATRLSRPARFKPNYLSTPSGQRRCYPIYCRAMAIPRGCVPAPCIVSTNVLLEVSITDRFPVR